MPSPNLFDRSAFHSISNLSSLTVCSLRLPNSFRSTGAFVQITCGAGPGGIHIEFPWHDPSRWPSNLGAKFIERVNHRTEENGWTTTCQYRKASLNLGWTLPLNPIVTKRALLSNFTRFMNGIVTEETPSSIHSRTFSPSEKVAFNYYRYEQPDTRHSWTESSFTVQWPVQITVSSPTADREE